jgi:hypothetical protein
MHMIVEGWHMAQESVCVGREGGGTAPFHDLVVEKIEEEVGNGDAEKECCHIGR